MYLLLMTKRMKGSELVLLRRCSGVDSEGLRFAELGGVFRVLPLTFIIVFRII